MDQAAMDSLGRILTAEIARMDSAAKAVEQYPIASTIRPQVALSGPGGLPGLTQTNLRLGLIHLIRKLPEPTKLMADGELVPSFLRSLAATQRSENVTIMWSDPRKTEGPDHNYYIDTGFFELPDGKWLRWWLSTGKIIDARPYTVLLKPHQFDGLGSFDYLRCIKPATSARSSVGQGQVAASVPSSLRGGSKVPGPPNALNPSNVSPSGSRQNKPQSLDLTKGARDWEKIGGPQSQPLSQPIQQAGVPQLQRPATELLYRQPSNMTGHHSTTVPQQPSVSLSPAPPLNCPLDSLGGSIVKDPRNMSGFRPPASSWRPLSVSGNVATVKPALQSFRENYDARNEESDELHFLGSAPVSLPPQRMRTASSYYQVGQFSTQPQQGTTSVPSQPQRNLQYHGQSFQETSFPLTGAQARNQHAVLGDQKSTRSFSVSGEWQQPDPQVGNKRPQQDTTPTLPDAKRQKVETCLPNSTPAHIFNPGQRLQDLLNQGLDIPTACELMNGVTNRQAPRLPASSLQPIPLSNGGYFSGINDTVQMPAADTLLQSAGIRANESVWKPDYGAGQATNAHTPQLAAMSDSALLPNSKTPPSCIGEMAQNSEDAIVYPSSWQGFDFQPFGF